MIFEDVAGLQPRLDDVVELWPIDMGFDHFAVNNLSYHGSDVTIVWQRPGGTTYYPLAPAGYSLYVDGQRAFTVDDLAHVTWDSRSGAVSVRDGSATHVLFEAHVPVKAADQVSLSESPRLVESFQKAGVDLVPATRSHVDLALGKTASASFTTTTPPSQATDPANAVDGFTISGLPVTSGSYVGTNPIWGTRGSPNAQDWYQVDLGAPTRFDTVKLYFYSNKTFGSGGNTYREPADYDVQYLDGTTWVDVPRQFKTPAVPQPNYNKVEFPPISASAVRVLMTPQPGYGLGLKEVQVFHAESSGLGTGNVTCANGQIDAGTVFGNLTVPAGAWCDVLFTTVKGNVRLQQGSGIRIVGATIAGNLQSDGTAAAADPLGTSENVVCESTIAGNLTVTGSSADSPWTIGGCGGNAIGGNLRFDGNASTFNTISNNDVQGNLTCSANGGVTGSDNKARGRLLGQCAALGP
jgi:hypothetical protein